tara:strand:+ start:1209 stop:1433 length:225 start_codon:yes stop_codon:yes gene_type:complete
MKKVELFETDTSTIKEYQKSQAVRLYDVFLLAPFLLYVGYKAKGLSKFQKYGVYFIGITTILYNGRNYLKNKNR